MQKVDFFAIVYPFASSLSYHDCGGRQPQGTRRSFTVNLQERRCSYPYLPPQSIFLSGILL